MFWNQFFCKTQWFYESQMMNMSRIIVLNNLSGAVNLHKYYVFTFVLYNQGVMHFPPPKASFFAQKGNKNFTTYR
jgi:hypothetical protein